MKVAISTTPAGGVAVTYPTPEILAVLTGDGRSLAWSGTSIGEQMALIREFGLNEVAWRAFLEAYENGGCTEEQALGLIFAKDVPAENAAVEIIDASELPADRTHRDAWRRSRNGGPIWIEWRN